MQGYRIQLWFVVSILKAGSFQVGGRTQINTYITFFELDASVVSQEMLECQSLIAFDACPWAAYLK